MSMNDFQTRRVNLRQAAIADYLVEVAVDVADCE